MHQCGLGCRQDEEGECGALAEEVAGQTRWVPIVYWLKLRESRLSTMRQSVNLPMMLFTLPLRLDFLWRR